MKKTILFISHASEDKQDFVRPLAEKLNQEFTVWYDEYELTLGDKLLQKIDAGLRACDYGVVVLSTSFFAKKWPQEELNGLFQLETVERKMILPVWKDVTADDVKLYSPILAGRLAAEAKKGIDSVISDIRRAVSVADRASSLVRSNWQTKLSNLDSDIGHKKRIETYSRTSECRDVLIRAAAELMSLTEQRIHELGSSLSNLRFAVESRTHDRVNIVGPKRISLNLAFEIPYTNTIDEAYLEIIVYKRGDFFDHPSSQILESHKFIPNFNNDMSLGWSNKSKAFATGDALVDYALEQWVGRLS